jgi:hypothetical protein
VVTFGKNTKSCENKIIGIILKKQINRLDGKTNVTKSTGILAFSES